MDDPAGHLAQEFHAGGATAPHLIDFVETFEGRFLLGRLRHSNGYRERQIDDRLLKEAVFVDAYQGRLIEICSGRSQRDWLHVVDMESVAVRVEAALYLITRTIPKIWPEVYADLFQPRRVRALLERQAEIITQRRQEVEAIEAEIQEELAFYAPYTSLTVTGDDALKDLVARAFTEVLGYEVTDLDALVGEGEQKTLDLLIRHGESTCFCEVRSRGDGNLRESDLERFEPNHRLASERHGPADHALIVFNGMFRQAADRRAASPPFGSQRVVDEAEDRGICLLSAQQLVAAIESVRNGELTPEAFFQTLTRPGVARTEG